MKVFKTACGGTIVVPAKAEDHLRAHPEVQALLQAAVSRVSLPQGGEFLAVGVEIGRVVGRSGCVATPRIRLDGPASFALRAGREKPSRVVLGVEGPETTKVAVLAFASRDAAGTYVLVTAFVGELAPKEPWDHSIQSQAEAQESQDFWCAHELVYDPAVMAEVFTSTWREVLEG